MALPNIFSRRKRTLAAAGREDVYLYDKVPPQLRVQLTLVWDDVLDWGGDHTDYDDLLGSIVRLMRREVGRYRLADTGLYGTLREELYNWFLNAEVDGCLDLIELSCRAMRQRHKPEGIEETNARMREHGIGYSFEGAELVRVDSKLVHAEVVKPLLSLLSDPSLASANKEFLDAHRFYRTGDGEQALTECCKAFESTLKVIAAKRRWGVSATATAKPLLDAAFTNGLVPEYLEGEFSALRSLLESGVPTVRNRSGGHGAGVMPRKVPPHLVAFQLHQTAAAMLFLVEADKANP